MFLERLSKSGIDTSQYYVEGGLFNTYSKINQMPNCTCYCMLRSFEASNASKPFPIAQHGTGFPSAKYWYSSSPLAKGKELKVGSIAVFDGVNGHVAFVERVIDSTHALISQSQYDSNKSLRNYKYWETREVELVVGKATLSGVGNLLGFLYLPIVDKRVKRDINREQISINEQMVNVRVKPNGDIYRQGCYAPMGIYNVLDKQNVDGYLWFKLDEDNWVREGEWLEYYELSDIANLKKENAELKEDIKKVNEIIKRWL